MENVLLHINTDLNSESFLNDIEFSAKRVFQVVIINYLITFWLLQQLWWWEHCCYINQQLKQWLNVAWLYDLGFDEWKKNKTILLKYRDIMFLLFIWS